MVDAWQAPVDLQPPSLTGHFSLSGTRWRDHPAAAPSCIFQRQRKESRLSGCSVHATAAARWNASIKEAAVGGKRACRAASCRAAIYRWLAVDDRPLLDYAR